MNSSIIHTKRQIPTDCQAILFGELPKMYKDVCGSAHIQVDFVSSISMNKRV